jgi:hypothetical protein
VGGVVAGAFRDACSFYAFRTALDICQQLALTSAGMPSPRSTVTPPLPLLPADHCCRGHQQGASAAAGLHASAPGGTHQPLLAGGAMRKATRGCGGGRAAGHDAGAGCSCQRGDASHAAVCSTCVHTCGCTHTVCCLLSTGACCLWQRWCWGHIALLRL